MKNAVIVNDLCDGKCIKIENLLRLLSEDGAVVIHLDKNTILKDLSRFEKIVVCGGDGTLHSVVNCKISDGAQVLYLPCGTLNESKQRAQNRSQISELGKAEDKYFSYVCAAGIFTPLGYVVDDKAKRKWKKWAYFGKILQEYKVHRIAATFELNGRRHEGQYALLMALDSPQCFGFKFNKDYEQDDGALHFLAIKSPKHDGFLGSVELFFPLFRTFFMGFKHSHNSKNITFEKCRTLKLRVNGTVPFDMDGEKVEMSGEFVVSVEKCRYFLQVVSLNELKQQKLLASGKKVTTPNGVK